MPSHVEDQKTSASHAATAPSCRTARQDQLFMNLHAKSVILQLRKEKDPARRKRRCIYKELDQEVRPWPIPPKGG